MVKLLYKKSYTEKIRCNCNRGCYNKTDVSVALPVEGGEQNVKRENSSSGSNRKYCGI